MTDQELIKVLRICNDGACEDCPFEDSEAGCAEVSLGNAADRLEALLAENEHLREATKKMWCEKQYGEDINAPTKWVSVSEQLPERNDKQVLVVVNGIYDGIHFHDAVEIAEFVMDEGWILESWPDWENPCVTFWHPLPKPPSTEGVE